MPLDDAAFDVVLCQMGMQFFADRPAGLAEIRRVLAPSGRALVNVPGPMPELFDAFARALARHVGPEAPQFVHQVFGLHDATLMHDLFCDAGFGTVTIDQDLTLDLGVLTACASSDPL